MISTRTSDSAAFIVAASDKIAIAAKWHGDKAEIRVESSLTSGIGRRKTKPDRLFIPWFGLEQENH